MKNLNLIKRLWKTDSHEKQTPQRFARYAVMLIMLLTLGVGQAWGWGWTQFESTSPATIYPGDQVTLQILLNGDGNGATYKAIGSGTTNAQANLTWNNSDTYYDYVEKAGDNHRWKFYFTPNSTGTWYWSIWLGWGSSVGNNGRYYNGSTSWNDGNDSYQSSSVTVSAVPKSGSLSAVSAGTTSIALSWSKNSLSDDVIIFNGNSTTPSNGSTYSVGSNNVVYKGNGTSTTITGLTANTSYTFYIYSIHQTKYYSASNNATAKTDDVATPAITLTSVSPASSIVAGNDITLVGTRANSSNAISFQYTTNDGSTWTDISPKTSSTVGNATTATWTVPDAHGATQTFKFRACLAADSKESAKSSGVTVYNTKTIHVKNTNNWSSLYLYAWDSGSNKLNGNWPGTTGAGSNGLSCTNTGGQWWDVVITSQVSGFVLNANVSGDANQTADLSYSTYTDDRCLAIGTGSGKKTLTNTVVDCPDKPDVTTAAAGSFTNSKATLNASDVDANNDAITAYGFKWGTTTACANTQPASNLSSTTFSYQLTGLTAGTTYYFKAYATNGQGTTEGSRLSFVVPYKVTVTKPTGCSEITNSGTNYTSSSITIVATKATGYTFSSWSTTNGTQTSTSSEGNTNTLVFTPTSDNATIQPVYTENDYIVTVTAGDGGTVASGSVTGRKDTKVTLPTATPYPGYRFTGWTTTTGSLTYTNQSSASTAQVNGLTAAATVQANFTRTYAYLEGRMTVCNSSRGSETNIGASKGVWADGSTNVPMTYDETNHRFYRHTYKRPDELKAQQSSQNQWFYVKVSQADGSLSNPTAYHPSGSNGEFSAAGYANKIAAPTTTATYNFRINASTNDGYAIIYFDESYVWYELEHSFKYNGNGNTSGNVPASRTYYDNGATVTVLGNVDASPLVKTGYTFNNWKTGESSGTSYSAGNTFSITTNTTLYAQWTPKSCTVNFNFNESDEGWGSSTGATNSTTATYDSDMPTVTPPTAKNGYAFMGYWDNSTGSGGNQYYKADGTSNKQWDKDRTEAITLYARYKKAEITEITLNATAFEPVEAGKTGYVVANPTIDPTPTGTTSICWKLLYDNDNPVPGHDVIDDPDGSHPNRVKFSIAGLAAGGYKVQATLYTGDGDCGSGTTLSVQEASFTIASDFTVTILYKCGDFSLKASTSVSGKPLDWSDDITAPDITGYTFTRWDAGDGITIKNGDSDPVTTSTDQTIKIKANYDGNLTAVYTKKDIIYFYNTLGWEHVYVYFYSSGAYWDNSNGTGANYTKEISSTKAHWRHFWGEMTPTGDENIYYFDYQEAAKTIDPSYWSEINGYTNVAFTKDPQGFGYGADGDDADKIGDGYEWFYNTDVVRRGDFSHSLPMFVPLSSQTKVTKNSNADYYNEGYWMNYPENTGYTLRIYSKPDADNATGASREYMIPYSSDKRMPLKQDVEINFSGETWFLIYRNDGNYLQGSAGHDTFKQSDHDDEAVSSTSDAGSAYKLKVISDAEGIYTFNLSFHGNGANPEVYNYYVNVDFPAAVGDYRIVYKDNAEWSQGSAHTSSWCHPSKVIPKIKGGATEAKKDTVSFFVAKGDGITTSMKFQYISAINGTTGAVTWTDVASGSITIPSSITTSGVYNFIVTQPVGGGSISVESAEPYTGNYYIRTDNAGDTKWNNYRSRDHQMVYTEFSRNRATNTFGELYTHYFTSWCERSTNIKFCIANDYSPCISDTLGQDVGNPYGNTDTGGNLNTDGATLPIDDKYSANVRFMYNETTNKICRAYVGSSTNPARKFLMLEGNVELHGDDDEAITDWDPRYALILVDKQNWIYEHTLKIKPKTRFKLYACYAQTTVSPDGAQYFRGAYDSNNFTTDANSVILIDGAVDADYQMARIIYDFKTNRLMTAWIPSGSDVSGNMEINADVLVEREHQEPAQYITFANASSQLSGVKTVYGAMKFNRWILNNRGGSSDDDPDHGKTAEQIATYHAPLPVGQQKSIYERSLYFISFPFDVNASEIFGFGHYWDEWYLEYYDGLTRAKNGYWEDSPPNWKYVMPSMLNDFVLKANEGYILGLDLDFMQADNFDFWSNGISTVELFFPSTTTQETLKQTNCTIPALSAIEGDPYRCTINRGTPQGDRRVKDSYWRCLGVPSFNIYNTSLTDGEGHAITWQPDGNTLPFIYAWNKADNTLTAQSTSTFTFLPMHAYLVQNGGEIRWTNVSAKPASPIVARRVNEQPATEYEWRLALTSDSVLIDQTYVKMSNIEQVTDTFDFNQDMIKEFNAYRSDIYTYIGYERVAANSMPLQTEQTTVIPVGVKIKDAGDYTFAMPDGTNGVGVTLVDTQTGVRTNLGLMDYTVTLTAGSFNQRFVLEISPIMQTPTDIEEVTGDGLQVTGVRKVLIDQKMYIIRDGKVYDARGAKVK